MKLQLKKLGENKFVLLDKLGMTHSTTVSDCFGDVKLLNLSEVKQLIGEVDVEKKAMDKLKDKWQHLYQFGYPKRPFPTNYENDLNMVMIGYNQAIEDNKDKKYSEDDMYMLAVKAIDIVLDSDGVSYATPIMIVNDFIQSLQPNTWNVEFDENGKLKLL